MAVDRRRLLISLCPAKARTDNEAGLWSPLAGTQPSRPQQKPV
jgi:hypothetical protein